MSNETNIEAATKKQATSGRKSPITIIATVEQPRCHKPSGWQAVGIRPVEAGGEEARLGSTANGEAARKEPARAKRSAQRTCREPDNEVGETRAAGRRGVIITSIVGVTPITLCRFLRVKVTGYIESRFGKYQLVFTECEEVAAEYKNPILTILARAEVPKVRGLIRGFLFVVAYVFLAPIAAKTAILDAKLDPEGGEDETRVLIVRGKQLKPEEKKRLSRSFCRRWLRAANYRRENIERAIEGKPVDNCPRLTRAKRNLWRSLKDDHTRSTERMKVWRDTGDNLQKELDMQTARREIEAELNFHANVTIDDVECERPIIAADGEGADDLVNFIPRDGIDWPDHHTILLGAGGVGFTKDGKVLDLPTVWAGHEDKRGARWN